MRTKSTARWKTTAAGACIVACFLAHPVSAQGGRAPAGTATLDIFGTVTDARTGEPIPEMEVVVRTPDGARVYRTLANDNGRFRITVDTAGEYVIAMTRLGYSGIATTEVEVVEGEDLYVDLEVEPEALGIEPITVTVSARSPYLRAEGFYERMEAGNGFYLERNQIEAMPAAWPSQVLRRAPDVRTGQGDAWVRRCGQRGTRVLIDGIQIDREVLRLDDIIAKEHIAAIEVYSAPELVPIELRRHLTCGVIAIWTTWGDRIRLER